MSSKKVIVRAARIMDLVDKVVNLASQGATRCKKSPVRLAKGAFKTVVMEIPEGVDENYEVERNDVYGATVVIRGQNGATLLDRVIDVAKAGGVRAINSAARNNIVTMIVPKAPAKQPGLNIIEMSVDKNGAALKSEEEDNNNEGESEVTQEVSQEVSETGTEEGTEGSAEEDTGESVAGETVTGESATVEDNTASATVYIEKYRYSREELKEKEITELKAICVDRNIPSRRSKNDCIKEILKSQEAL